jgi:stearoyl-CoA desaturase (delta-9 desaturase)
MMAPVRRIEAARADPVRGTVRFDLSKALWNGGAIALAAAAPFLFSWTAFILAAVLTYLTMLLGHSIGMHRMMIHRTFRARKWLARVLIYLGVIVGMGGPSRIIATHDLRDWAQRQPACHDFFAHRRNYLSDIAWQLFYRFEFEHPPKLVIEPELRDDPFYRFLDRTWRWHQLPVAALLFLAAGWPGVVWGIGVRLAISAIGHWTITYVCHNPGPARWHVRGAAVQASDLPGMAFLTHGECWHSNHHAFPESARIGLEPGQIDPAWTVICGFERLGWVYDVQGPRAPSAREDLCEVL